jgi:hypothetical protein
MNAKYKQRIAQRNPGALLVTLRRVKTSKTCLGSALSESCCLQLKRNHGEFLQPHSYIEGATYLPIDFAACNVPQNFEEFASGSRIKQAVK